MAAALFRAEYCGTCDNNSNSHRASCNFFREALSLKSYLYMRVCQWKNRCWESLCFQFNRYSLWLIFCLVPFFCPSTSAALRSLRIITEKWSLLHGIRWLIKSWVIVGQKIPSFPLWVHSQTTYNFWNLCSSPQLASNFRVRDIYLFAIRRSTHWAVIFHKDETGAILQMLANRLLFRKAHIVVKASVFSLALCYT